MSLMQKPLAAAPLTDFDELIALELSPAAIFPSFTASTAWDLGNALRTRILSLPSAIRKPALISIALTSTAQHLQPHVIFQAVTESGTIPDNEVWVRRKRNTVLRWGSSSWAQRRKLLATAGADEAGLEAALVKKFALVSSSGGQAADDYCLSGGGFPIRVRGVDGIVGVIVVSGLKQEDDHQVIVETVKEFITSGGN